MRKYVKIVMVFALILIIASMIYLSRIPAEYSISVRNLGKDDIDFVTMYSNSIVRIPAGVLASGTIAKSSGHTDVIEVLEIKWKINGDDELCTTFRFPDGFPNGFPVSGSMVDVNFLNKYEFELTLSSPTRYENVRYNKDLVIKVPRDFVSMNTAGVYIKELCN